MGKYLAWGGFVGLIVFAFCLFFSGASSGIPSQPSIPFLYGTNQIMWLGLAALSAIAMLVGLILVIVKAVRHRA